jgi:hypothetical protein
MYESKQVLYLPTPRNENAATGAFLHSWQVNFIEMANFMFQYACNCVLEPRNKTNKQNSILHPAFFVFFLT